jgi:hypothetical protein
VAWALENRSQPILERATAGLLKLTEREGDRIIRLVVRRCRLSLLELHGDQVVVQHWGQNRADLRPFFKQYRLARPEIEVVLRNRKKEAVTRQPGDDFLFGERLAPDFPLELFQTKWTNRFAKEADDWQAAPGTSSGFTWDGIEANRIPWAALKAAWKRAAPMFCQNCDGLTMLVNFGLRQVGMFNCSPIFVSVCSKCCRSFVDDSIKDVAAWMAQKLDADVLPKYAIVWGRRKDMQTKA